ncbi:MAG TPA: nucleoside-diphosphate kinase [Candidatus Deferrimicrobium sp.]|nr:nucleoside-diphosphate kinase [Candidatus Deferrimicrobium sp.]
MERSLVFLKPDAVLRRSVGAAILQEFLRNSETFSIHSFQEIEVSEELAKKHYQEHAEKPFFPWLVKSLRASPVIALIMEGEIQKVRAFLGATFVQKAELNSIRGKYGVWGGVNSVHASDGVETGRRELELWKKLANLQPDPEAIVKVQAYIKQWIGSLNHGNIQQLREVCRTLAENPNLKKQIYRQLIAILTEECPTASIKTIQNFANVILENVLL